MRVHTFVATTLVVTGTLIAVPFAGAQGRVQRWPSSAERGGQREAEGSRANPRGAERQGGEARQAPAPQERPQVRQAPAPEPRREAPVFAEQRSAQRRGGDQGGDRGGDRGRVQGDRGDRGRDDRAAGGQDRGGRYAVPRVGPAPRDRRDDRDGRRVYVQPRRNVYVYNYPYRSYYYGYPYGYGYGYSYYDPYFRGDFYWSSGSWRRYGYYGGVYGSSYGYDLGRLRLQVRQRDAQVFIDGYYAGIVDDFDGRLQGLSLEAGEYGVEIVLPGYETLAFDVRVTPGRTTTYRGDLLPERP